MATTTPTYWGWFVVQDQALMDADDTGAYDLPDYNGPRQGGGVYVDLYADPAREHPIGRLWAAGGNRAGLLHVASEDDFEYTMVALALRQRKAAGLDSMDAFTEVAGEYTAGPVYEGPLENIGDPEIEGNANI